MTEGYYVLCYILPSVLCEDDVGAWSQTQTERLMDSGQFDNADYTRSYLSVIKLLYCSPTTYKHNYHRNVSRFEGLGPNIIFSTLYWTD